MPIETANSVTISDPKFLTIVKKPANQTAFKVVRSAKPEGEAPMNKPTVRRVRRSEAVSPVMQMIFPTGYTDERVNASMSAYGLVGFTVSTQEDGEVLATRGDLKSISPDATQTILLTQDGIKAVVSRSEPEQNNPKGQIEVVSMVFRAAQFNPEQVNAWLKVNNVETESVAADGTGDFIVTRKEVPEGEEIRVVSLEDGVEATIIRSDCCAGIPDGYIAVVNETAYGNWGWGQLDFAARMADTLFSEQMDEANTVLRRVLNEILLYSSLPIADRKTLMVNALKQFETFATGLLDTLPRQFLVAVARSAETQQEKEMKSNTTGGDTTQPAADEKPDQTPITRADLSGLLAELLPNAIGAAMTQRAEAEAKAVAEADAADALKANTVTRADMIAAVEAATKPLTEEIAKLAGTTVLRSDNADTLVAVKGVTGEDGKQAAKDIFRGAPAFGGLQIKGRKTAAA